MEGGVINTNTSNDETAATAVWMEQSSTVQTHSTTNLQPEANGVGFLGVLSVRIVDFGMYF